MIMKKKLKKKSLNIWITYLAMVKIKNKIRRVMIKLKKKDNKENRQEK